MSGKGIKRDSRGARRYWCGTKYGWCDELRPAEKNKADVDSTSAADGFRAIVLERAVLNSKLQNADRTRAAYKTIFDSEQFSDITVVIGDREAKLHKCVLSGCEYFERMLSTEFKEATAKVVKLEVAEGSSAEATLLAIEYIYSGYFDFHQHSDSVMEVLAAADKLQLTHLRDVCVGYLEDNLCAENVSTVFSASRHLGLQKLEKQCLRFLLREGWEGAFSALRRPNGIEQLPKETLLSMLEGDDLNVDEEVVFTALVRWCEALLHTLLLHTLCIPLLHTLSTLLLHMLSIPLLYTLPLMKSIYIQDADLHISNTTISFWHSHANKLVRILTDSLGN